MAVIGVDTDGIDACGARFRGFPAPPAGSEIGGSARIRTAVSGFASAWGRADAVVVADEGGLIARIGRAAALYGEADASAAESVRRAAA